MTRTLSVLALFAALALLTAPAFADAPACYEFDCVNQTCEFVATCTTTSPVWRVWYDFGDGGTSGHVSPGTTVSHTYATYGNGGPAYPSVKLTVIPWSGPILTVTCDMPVNQTFGPPMLPYGMCE